MYGLRGNRPREKTALMPDPLRRSSFGCGTLDSRRMDMDMVRPRKDLWGLSPVGGPWEAWGSLMDLCGRSRPVGPPRSSCVACVGCVCHCHCGGDRSSRHPVRLVWVNGSFGCRTIAARTRDLILDTILEVTRPFGFTRIGEEERRDGEAIALHKTHIWANSLKPVCFLCFLLFWCPLLPFIETGTLKIYTKMVLYMKNEIFDLKYPLHGV